MKVFPIENGDIPASYVSLPGRVVSIDGCHVQGRKQRWEIQRFGCFSESRNPTI